MILPIVAYGDSILRQKAQSIQKGTEVQELVTAMFNTLDHSGAIGLAAPQVGESIRLFIIDFSSLHKGNKSVVYRRVYINPTLHIDAQEEIQYSEEGCMSIPDVYVQVPRKRRLVVNFFDSNWEEQQEELLDTAARVVQHEYDHLEGKLHIDYASALKRRLLQRKLNDISQGKIALSYPMRFAGKVVNPLLA